MVFFGKFNICVIYVTFLSIKKSLYTFQCDIYPKGDLEPSYKLNIITEIFYPSEYPWVFFLTAGACAKSGKSNISWSGIIN